MKLAYTIYQALESIMREIQDYEKDLRKEKRPYYKSQIKVKINWAFERGVSMLLVAKPGELTEETYDWFLGRTKDKPLHSQKDTLLRIKNKNINKVR